jgi:ParB-like chromosome segregation protein Spo0J
MADELEKSQLIPLSNLRLDPRNPRFGDPFSKEAGDQDSVLRRIVEGFGIDDLASSMAVNGYFHAEPVVVQPNGDGTFTVVEGNRRLAACLILTEETRATPFVERFQPAIRLWKQHDCPVLDPIPAIVFEDADKKNLLSYLGVRHIASSKSWDSYAKAAWVAQVVEQEHMAVRDVASMIGDQHRTIERLLQGYYVVKQLEAVGEFNPQDSQRKGRGSVSEYPFSWVYTVLGYQGAKQYLGLDGDYPPEQENPLPNKESQRRGGNLMRAMFGDKRRGVRAAVDDSRQLGLLASIVNDPEKLSYLENGKTVQEIVELTQDLSEHLRSGISQCRETLKTLLGRLTENDVDPTLARPLVEPSMKLQSLAAALEKKLKEVAGRS